MNQNQQLETSNKSVIEGDLIYIINEKEKTAGVKCLANQKKEIFIPRSIFHESTEYLVTRILKESFSLIDFALSIHFPKDSEIQIIEKNAFYDSSIENLTIPQSLVKLEDEWCRCTPKITKIDIIGNNPFFKIHENKFILGKSSPEQENFNVLLFCVRDIVTVKIPDFIEIIGPFSFHKCHELRSIEFSINSKLKLIQNDAFNESSIESILIPSEVTRICKSAFYYCRKLQRVEFSKNSKLQIIEKDAFSKSSIECFTIPSNLIKLEEGWCQVTKELKKIDVMENNRYFKNYDNKFILGKSTSKHQNFDVLVYCVEGLKTLKIPDFIEIIGPYSFIEHYQPHIIEFSNDSKLRIIGESAFSGLWINRISIPSQVIKICKGAFKYCMELRSIEIPNDSKLEVIEKGAFSHTKIERISIPSQITEISENVFKDCQYLKRIEIPNDSKIQIISNGAFNNSSIESLRFPSNLIELKEEWCKMTSNLNKIDVDENNRFFKNFDNKLVIGKSSPEQEKFDVLVFCNRNVKTVKIPLFIEIIGPYSFNDCQNIKRIEISNDSKLRVISKGAFSASSIESISMPSQVTQICESAFEFCHNFKRIEIQSDSKLKIIEKNAFNSSSIESIFIPSKVIRICDYAFWFCGKLKIIEFDENSVIDDISKNLFQYNVCMIIMIPINLSCRLDFKK